MAKYRMLGSFVIFQGIWTSIVKKPIFSDFKGVRTPCPHTPFGSVHISMHVLMNDARIHAYKYDKDYYLIDRSNFNENLTIL